MTYMKYTHPPIYYTIRTLVRTVFWGGLATLSIYGLMHWASSANAYNPCPIKLHSNFTYSTTEWYPTMECDMPENVEVDLQGNWWWAS